MEVVACGRCTVSSGGIFHHSRSAVLQLNKTAIDIFGIVDLVLNRNEGLEVAAPERNVGPTGFWADRWRDLLDLRPVVVEVAVIIIRELLIVH